jgi:hypothetical protein
MGHSYCLTAQNLVHFHIDAQNAGEIQRSAFTRYELGSTIADRQEMSDR